jgi:hypothetical protein
MLAEGVTEKPFYQRLSRSLARTDTTTTKAATVKEMNMYGMRTYKLTETRFSQTARR